MPRLLAHCQTQKNAMLRLWVLCLVVSLLVAQTLGQLHAVHHGGAQHVADAAAVQQAHEHHAHEDHAVHHDDDFSNIVFSSHHNEKECRLYDQLRDVHATPTVVTVALLSAVPGLAVADFQGQALARWAALFDARGPPLTV